MHIGVGCRIRSSVTTCPWSHSFCPCSSRTVHGSLMTPAPYPTPRSPVTAVVDPHFVGGRVPTSGSPVGHRAGPDRVRDQYPHQSRHPSHDPARTGSDCVPDQAGVHDGGRGTSPVSSPRCLLGPVSSVSIRCGPGWDTTSSVPSVSTNPGCRDDGPEVSSEGRAQGRGTYGQRQGPPYPVSRPVSVHVVLLSWFIRKQVENDL